MNLQLRSDVTTPSEDARPMPKPVALESTLVAASKELLWMGLTYTSPKLIRAQTEIFVFIGSLTLQMT